MPLGGSVISWDNTTPPGTESIGLGDDRIRSMKTSVQEALDNEHNFASTGGASTGYHKFGSARAHFGTQSRVSSGDTDGRLMIASDTSRLFGVGSTGSVLLGGGPLVLSLGSAVAVTFPQRAHMVVETGVVQPSADTFVVVTFPNSGFSTVPTLLVSESNRSSYASSVVPAAVQPFVGTLSATSFGVAFMNASNSVLTAGDDDGALAFSWLAIGSRTL